MKKTRTMVAHLGLVVYTVAMPVDITVIAVTLVCLAIGIVVVKTTTCPGNNSLTSHNEVALAGTTESLTLAAQAGVTAIVSNNYTELSGRRNIPKERHYPPRSDC